MKFHAAICMSLMIGLLAPALPAKSVPQKSKLGATGDCPPNSRKSHCDPNLRNEKQDDPSKTSAVMPVYAESEMNRDVPFEGRPTFGPRENNPRTGKTRDRSIHSYSSSTQPALLHEGTESSERQKAKK